MENLGFQVIFFLSFKVGAKLSFALFPVRNVPLYSSVSKMSFYLWLLLGVSFRHSFYQILLCCTLVDFCCSHASSYWASWICKLIEISSKLEIFLVGFIQIILLSTLSFLLVCYSMKFRWYLQSWQQMKHLQKNMQKAER